MLVIYTEKMILSNKFLNPVSLESLTSTYKLYYSMNKSSVF